MSGDKETTKPEAIAAVESKAVEKLVSGFKYEIISQDTYNQAGEWLKAIKTKAKDLDTLRKSMTSPLDIAKKRIMELFQSPLDRLTKAEADLKRGILGYQQEQERIRRTEEARLQELARKEEEKRRKELEAKAAKAEAKGNAEKAEELRQQKEEVFVPAPIVPTQVEKVAGIQTKTVWRFEILNEAEIDRDYLAPNMEKIGAVVRATKGTLQLKGIRIYSEEIIAAGR